MSLRRAIKRAIEQDELKLYYQPIIELATNEIAGHEALIRWHHPIDELLMPIDFIPDCENDPLTIVEICEFVVKRSWRDRPKLKGGFISVNISPKSLEQQRFWDVLEEHSLIGDRPSLFLEITERSLTNHKIVAPYFLSTGGHGIGAFVDDFGVEYSGFIQVAKVLNLFPSTKYIKVKLDIEFARNLADPVYQWFTKSIITSMRDCPAGGIEIIAEGIEHEWQCEIFKELGVKYGQGWLWGKAEALD